MSSRAESACQVLRLKTEPGLPVPGESPSFPMPGAPLRFAPVYDGRSRWPETTIATNETLATEPAIGCWTVPPPSGTIRRVQQSIVTLDMEGVLTPEIWIAVAEKTGIKELRLTTRDIPDYDVLMKGRLKILDQHGLKLSDIQAVIGTLHPLDGALEFMRQVRETTQVIILSDTFEEFAKPLLRQLEWPALLCHKLEVVNDRVVDYRLRIPNQKQRAVAAFRGMNYHVIAAGDSFNDTAMLAEANIGILFRAPVAIQKQFAQFPAVEEYSDLLRLIKAALN